MMKTIRGNRILRALAVLVCATAVLVAISVVMMSAQGVPQKKMDLPHESTWDADMIDSNTGYTGEGVYVAVLDTGLAPNWADYLPADSVATELGRGFYEPVTYDPKTGLLIESGKVVQTGWIGSISSTHGTHVASTIVGYNYYSSSDAGAGLPLNPVFVEGIAPDAKIIPVKVLSDYNFKIGRANFGTDKAVAAGIDYVTGLAKAGYKPMVISMSLGGPEPSEVIEDAVNRAIEAGVIVVAAAGNAATEGMDWPGAYPQVISAGSCGWRYEWYAPSAVAPPPRYRLWWLQDNTYGYNDIPEPTLADDVYVSDFSGREISADGQQLDVLAPGSWVRGPYPGYPGYCHLPWWSQGKPAAWQLSGGNNFYYVGGTSMSTPHVSATAAMMLEKDPTLTQSELETILKETALPIPAGSMVVWDLTPSQGWYTRTWGSDATGAGLLQASAAIEEVD